MSITFQRYLREMHRHFGYLATWNPGSPMELGDIGLIQSGVFQRKTSLKLLGFEPQIRPDETPTDLNYESATGVSMSIKLQGEPALPGSSLAQASAGVTFEFSENGAVVFAATGATSPSLSDVLAIEEFIKQLPRWDSRFVIITEVVQCKTATVLVSGSQSAKIELNASGALAAASFSIADASLNLSISSYRNVGVRILCHAGLTPLYQAVRLEGLFTKRLERVRSFRAPAAVDNNDNARLTSLRLGDLLDTDME